MCFVMIEGNWVNQPACLVECIRTDPPGQDTRDPGSTLKAKWRELEVVLDEGAEARQWLGGKWAPCIAGSILSQTDVLRATIIFTEVSSVGFLEKDWPTQRSPVVFVFAIGERGGPLRRHFRGVGRGTPLQPRARCD